MNSEQKPVLFAADGHPDENQLLLAFERELTDEEMAQVEQHLGSCWSCRARSEEMQRGILAFVEYREKKYIPSLSTPPNDFRNFRGNLRASTQMAPRAGLLVRSWRWFLNLFVWPAQVKWASVVAAGMTLLILWLQVVDPSPISANEFVSRAIAAQNQPAPREAGKRAYIARQKIRIRSGDWNIVKTFEWTVSSAVQQPVWDLRLDPLQWNLPLTPVAFAAWRDTLKKRKDKVKRSAGFLTLDTAGEQSPVKEAWIVVRADDFHLVEQHLRFADDRQVDFSEVEFKVAEEAQESESAPQSQSRAVKKIEPLEAVSEPSQAELDATEMKVRYTLFRRRWDLDDDLAIGRGPGRVTLTGTVSSAEREKEMRAAFQAFPNLQVSIGTPSPLSSGATRPNGGLSSRRVTDASIPLLRSVMDSAFQTREDRFAFIDRCLAASDTELAHAWALKRLADRYSESELQNLASEGKEKLHEMLRAHLQAVSQSNTELGPLLELIPLSPASAPLPAAPPNWQAGVLSLFGQVQQQDDLVASLVVGTRKGGRDLAAASASLRSVHQNIAVLPRGIANLK